jgi:hypothetical protein
MAWSDFQSSGTFGHWNAVATNGYGQCGVIPYGIPLLCELFFRADRFSFLADLDSHMTPSSGGSMLQY